VTAVFLIALTQASDLGLPQHLQRSIPCPPSFDSGQIDAVPSKFRLGPFFLWSTTSARIYTSTSLFVRILTGASLNCLVWLISFYVFILHVLNIVYGNSVLWMAKWPDSRGARAFCVKYVPQGFIEK